MTSKAIVEFRLSALEQDVGWLRKCRSDLWRRIEMSWDEIYRRLEEELGHEPDSGEVQNRILEMLDGQFKDMACDLLERRWQVQKRRSKFNTNINTTSYPSHELQNVRILRNVISFISWKTPQFSSDILSPKCLHRCWFCLYRVRINVIFCENIDISW